MVDSQSLKNPFINQFENIAVIKIECFLMLHVQADEAIDGKKPSVVDFMIGFLPITQAVMLIVNNLF
ncbi:hypothetical protein D3C87_1156830 [compost metagenome]